MTLHNHRLRCLPGNSFRDEDMYEDCMNCDPWPGAEHGCYQGSRAASAALTSSLMPHHASESFDRCCSSGGAAGALQPDGRPCQPGVGVWERSQ
jgi:hypothetical protein